MPRQRDGLTCFASGAVESLSNEIWMKIIGARLCNLEQRLPKDDIAVILKALNSVDGEALQIVA